jgi:hypothetical protein
LLVTFQVFSSWFRCHCEGVTYEWQTAVRAPANLRLIHVDEDPRVAQRTASAVAGYDALVCPADGLLVDEFDGGVGAGLVIELLAMPCTNAPSPFLGCRPRTIPNHTLEIYGEAYLILHNTLLKPRPTHRNLPRLLAPAPNALIIRRLLRPHALRVRDILLQHLVKRAF